MAGIMKPLAIMAAVLTVAACSSHRVPNIPNPSRGGVPGALQLDWQATHPKNQDPGMCVSRDEPTGISEIAIERNTLLRSLSYLHTVVT
jgi:hypothetical protein